jgi:endoglucanase
VIGGVDANSYRAVTLLDLPNEDRNLIVAFHYYEPVSFTHRAAPWIRGSEAWDDSTWDGSPAQRTDITAALDLVSDWAIRHRRPIYLSEFGTYGGSGSAPLLARTQWTEFVARAAEARSFDWAYWELLAGFGIYDDEARAWRAELLGALIPKTGVHE